MKSDSSSQLTEWKTISQTVYSKSHARGSWLMSYILLSKHTYTHTYSWSSKKRIWNGWNQHSFMQETVLPYHSPSSASCSQQLKLSRFSWRWWRWRSEARGWSNVVTIGRQLAFLQGDVFIYLLWNFIRWSWKMSIWRSSGWTTLVVSNSSWAGCSR